MSLAGCGPRRFDFIAQHHWKNRIDDNKIDWERKCPNLSDVLSILRQWQRAFPIGHQIGHRNQFNINYNIIVIASWLAWLWSWYSKLNAPINRNRVGWLRSTEENRAINHILCPYMVIFGIDGTCASTWSNSDYNSIIASTNFCCRCPI